MQNVWLPHNIIESVDSISSDGPDTPMYMYVLYFTIEAPTCFDSYNQPRLGGGQLFEHAAIELWKRPPKSISTLLPCSYITIID